jgi:RND family efflux transporter MFP subunit
MNYESSKWSREAIDDVPVDEEELARRRKRRRIIIAIVLILVIVVAAFMFMRGGGSGGEKGPPAKAAMRGNGQMPAVTFIVPTPQEVPIMITATGSLAAVRDMPVGVAGEGGQVVRVLVEPGQSVRAGQVLAIINRSVQSQTASQLAAQIDVARADLQLAQNNLQRAESLVGRGFISRADLDQKRATRDAAAARVRVAVAQLNATRAQIGRLDIRAPANGLVLTRSVEAGQVVGPGSGALFRIAAGGEMELLARLPQSDLARLPVGAVAQVTPVGSTNVYPGAVWQKSPTIDPQSRQGVARIRVPLNDEIRPGGFATANIQAGVQRVPLLPDSAVQSDSRGTFVYILNANNEVVRRDVVTGQVSDQGVSIVQGLTGTERVVQVAGAFLSPGQKVRPERAQPAR